MPMPQPNFVPVRPTTSRMTQSRGVSSSTFTVTARPLMRNAVMVDASGGRTSLGCAGLLADRGDLRIEIGPGRQIGAGASQIGGDPGDVGVSERVGVAWHHDARHTLA